MTNDIKDALKTIPVPDDLDKSVYAGIRRAESERNGIKMEKKFIFKVAAIAACAAIILTASLSAVAAYISPFMKSTMTNKAYGAALEYAVRHADSEEQSISIGAMLINGLEYDKSTEESSVDFGIDGFTPIYNVRFKVAGFAYDIQVDANSFEVISYERTSDEGWEEHLAADADTERDISEQPVTTVEAILIAQDWFGLYNTQNCEDSSMSSTGGPENDGESYTFSVYITHGGYVYSCNVDPFSGKVIKASITEEKGKSKERHRHESSNEYIGLYKASQIVLEEYRLSYNPYDYFNAENMYAMHIDFIAKTQKRGEKTFDSGYEDDVYLAVLQLKETSIRAEIVINAKTGEIISNRIITE